MLGPTQLTCGIVLDPSMLHSLCTKTPNGPNIHGAGNNGKLNQNRGLRWTKDAYLECYQCDSQENFQIFVMDS